MTGWGFIGSGSIATTSLAPAVHRTPGSFLQCVAARDEERARRLEPRRFHRDYAAVLDDPAVDIVYVALHNSAHLPWVRRAIDAGKHVLCEKPLGLNAGDARDMAGYAARHDRLLVEAVWNRWHPRSRDLERLVADGRVGDVTSVTAVFDAAVPAEDNYRWDRRLGGGALLDVGCYAVGAVLAAFGWQEPFCERAETQRRRPGEADAVTTAHLAFPNGGANIRAAFSERQAQHLEIRGTSGSAVLADPAFTAGAGPASLILNGTQTRYPPVDPYQLMAAEIAAAVRGEPAFVVPLAQSIAVAAALDAIAGTACASTKGDDTP